MRTRWGLAAVWVAMVVCGAVQDAQAGTVLMSIRDHPVSSYAVVSRGEAAVQFNGHSADLTRVRRLRASYPDGFVWFRREGREYVLLDAALRAKVNGFWSVLEADQKEMERLQERMEPLSKQIEAAAKEHEQVLRRYNREVDGPREVDRALKVLDVRMRGISQKMELVSEEMEGVSARIEAASEGARDKTLELLIAAQDKAMLLGAK